MSRVSIMRGGYCSSAVDAEVFSRKPIHRIEQKMHDVALGNPVAQIGRQKRWSITIEVFESGSHNSFQLR